MWKNLKGWTGSDVRRPLATFRGLWTKGGDSWHQDTVGGGLTGSKWPTATPIQAARPALPSQLEEKGLGREAAPSINQTIFSSNPANCRPRTRPHWWKFKPKRGRSLLGPTSILHFQCLPPFTWDWLASGCHLLSYLPPTPVSSPGREPERPVSIFFPFRDNYHPGAKVLQLRHLLCMWLSWVCFSLCSLWSPPAPPGIIPESTARSNSSE